MLVSCESDQDKITKQRKEETEKIMAPRKEKVDPSKAKGTNRY